MTGWPYSNSSSATSSNGHVSILSKTVSKTGTFTFTVTGVAAKGLTWNGQTVSSMVFVT